MFEIRDARASYGGPDVLHGASLSVEQGEVVAIVGRNGVGKTTLLRFAMGLVKRSRGTLRLGGVDLTNKRTHERVRLGIAYVPQGRQIFPRLTVRDNIRAALIAQGNDVPEELERVLEHFPVLSGRLNALGGTLSGGQQQMLAIARAMAVKPKVLLLDEPTEGIQPSVLDEIADSLQRINQEENLSVVVVEQNLAFVARLARRAYIMDKGAIHREVSVTDLVQDEALQQEVLGV